MVLRMRRYLIPVLFVAAMGLPGVAATGFAQNPTPQDYTQWRGERRDGSASAFAEPQRWPERLTQKWKVEVGEGYGTPLLVSARVYTLTRQGTDEVMAARNADTGAVVWQTKYAAPHKIMTGASAH